LAESIAAILGWCALVAGVGAVAWAIGRRAAADRILAPVLVGVGLRVGVMVIANLGSLSLHDHGIFFVDDRTHFNDARKLAGLWRDGHIPDPSSVHVVGTLQFGYAAFVGILFTLGTNSILLGKLANVLLGGITIYLVARIAGNVLGERAKLRAAWIAALAPSLVWWSVPLMKEALATMLVAVGILAVTQLPRRRAVVTLGLLLPVLMVVRSAAVLALVAGAGVAVAIAGRQAERRWLSRPLVAFGSAVAACLVAAVLFVSHGNVVNFYDQYAKVIRTEIRLYQGSNPARIPFDAVKSLVTPVPWAFDAETRNWDRGLYPGVWLLLCALPLAAVGAWRLRRHPEGWLLVVTIATSVTANAFTSGFVFRQRSMVEPLILLLALAGTRSWRMAARTASAALAAAALAAGIQSGSPLVVAVIATAGGVLCLISRWLPGQPFGPLPESRLVASFGARQPASEGGDMPTRSRFETGSRVGVDVRRSLRTASAALVSARAAVLRAAPRVGGPPVAGASFGPSGGHVRALVMRLTPGVDRRAEPEASEGARAAAAAHSALAGLAPRLERGDTAASVSERDS
jgi:hypothetical protein